MVDKLLQSLKTKYAHLGLEESVLKAIATRLATAVKEESEIENAVKGVEEEVKLLQSVADKGRTSLTKAEEARKKLEKELEEMRAKSNPNPQNPPTPSTDPKPDEVPEWAKDLLESVKKQNETIAAFQAEKQQQSAKERFLNQLKTQGVSETFYKHHLGRTFKDDTEMDAFVNELKADEQAFLQTQANAGLSSHSRPIIGGGTDANGVSADVQAYINETFNKQ
ncbi:spindle pole body component Spc42p [Capnocytophaga sputigena]|uniref:Spindle pole body component Spc42p n=1 Tax=Capnocytophaga sputigena TaxID=1019 RepID=A0A250F5G7_CAPSP|nr:spindle pole body component Spc42p [Capnocytophaga sputigena]ATA79308.1 spindle pole body component Spc42p [Capnocytophaga sputigena]